MQKRGDQRQGRWHNQTINGAPYASTVAVQDVGVHHRSADVTVAEELLDGPDVVAILEQVRGERVS